MSPLDLDGVRKRKQKRSGGGWRPDDGPNKVRILPPTSEYFDGDIDFIALSCNIHYFRQEGYDTVVSRCLRDNDQYCPACEQVSQFRDDDQADPALSKTADDISRTERHFFNVIDLEEPDMGVQAYQCGYNVHKALLEYAANPEWGDFMHPEEGRDVTITLTPGSRTKSGWNEYSVQPAPDRTDRRDLLPDNWRDQLDQLEYALPEYMEREEMLRVLDRLGFPVESDREEESTGKAQGPAAEEPAAAPDPEPEPEPTSEPEPAEEPDPEPEEPEPEPEDTAPADEELKGDPTRKALERAGDPQAIVNPPAASEDDTPFCFGDYEPEEHPCHPCGAKEDCQLATLTMDD